MIAFSFIYLITPLSYSHLNFLLFFNSSSNLFKLHKIYVCYLFSNQAFCYDNNNLFLPFCMYRIFIITKYDNNVITIFDNDKYIYHSFSF